MKIFYISQVSIPSTSAQSVGVMCLCDAFASLGHDTTVIIKNKLWSHAPDGYCGNDSDFYGVGNNFKIRKILALPRFTSLFHHTALRGIEDGDSFVFTRSVSLTSLVVKMQRKVVLEIHDAYVTEKEELLRRCVSSPYLLGVVVITEALREHFLQRIPALADKMVVAPDGVRYFAFADATCRNPEDNSGESDFVAGYVGSFHKGKGAEIVIELAKLCPDVSFEIYGGSEEKLKSSFNIEQLPGNLTVGGFVSQADVPRVMASFDIALLPNQEKVLLPGGQDIGKWTSPMKMFEYMASGRAIIASNPSVLREILEDGSNAILVSPTDYGAWRDAIKLLQSNADLRKRLGKQAQDEAREKYSWQARAESILKGLRIEAKL